LHSRCCISGGALRAYVDVPGIFSDHMVLQKATWVPIWGTATASEAITITVGSASAKATADIDGKWKAVLNLSREGLGRLTITAECIYVP
jgi:sialate O-acetylesterase